MADFAMYLFTSPSRRLKDGTFPVVLRVTHKSRQKYFATKYYCSPEQWDLTTRRFTRKFSDYKDANKDLSAQEAKAKTIIDGMNFHGLEFDFDSFTRQYTGKSQSRKLEDYFRQHIKNLKDAGKSGTAAPFEQTLNAILSFRPTAKDMLLSNVTYSFLLEFDQWLRAERKLKDTSISVYMRALRTILNKGIKESLLKRDHYPFDTYLISKLDTQTQRRAIPKATIKAIEALELEDNPRLQFARDIFIFSYYTRGMNFADIAYLTGQNIDGEHLRYIRKKTGGTFSIKLRPETRRIIDYYRSKSSADAGGYLFPVFDDRRHRTEAQKFTRRQTALKDVNRALKEIAELVGFKDMELTTYTARHSYAQVLKEAGTPTGTISEAMGHQSERVTQIYLKSLGNDTIDKTDDVL